jgi:hypothetical protein
MRLSIIKEIVQEKLSRYFDPNHKTTQLSCAENCLRSFFIFFILIFIIFCFCLIAWGVSEFLRPNPIPTQTKETQKKLIKINFPDNSVNPLKSLQNFLKKKNILETFKKEEHILKVRLED